MESMQVVLDMTSKLPAHQISDLDKIWARDLKELSYDIEDSVDAFMVRVDAPVSDAKRKSFRRFFDRTIGLLTTANRRHHIANDIEEIKKRINEVAARRERYKFQDTAVQPDAKPVDPRMLASFEHASKLVGVDGPTEMIVNLLTQGKVKVVSIVGVGGLGKTTIANSLYQRFGGQFDCKAFISVSQKPNMKQIFGSILRQVAKDKCTNAGEKEPEELIRNIREFLEDKRYLVVIDDVWDKEAWKIINSALIDNNLDSKVVMTTRNMDVAKFSTGDGTIYELDPLSDEESKILLCKRVFNEEDLVHPELEEVTKKILKKCGGVPLAIITIASMLASRPTYDWYDVYNSMGSGLRKDKSFDNMREILYLSYGDLPSYLKPCLLYLSMFPEDSEIPKDGLVWLWIGEGFVDSKQGSNLYDQGEMYFNELVNRSMIQPIRMDELGSPQGGRVHDMILDLIIFLSAQENFVTIAEDLNHISPVCKIRRLSLQDSKVYSKEQGSIVEQGMVPATVNMSHVRSLIVSRYAFQCMFPLSGFSALRVLSMKNYHPQGLGSLHHLRYVKLEGELKTELLEKIENLQFLKTLDLSGAFIIELPACIVRLRELEQLIIGRGVKLPDGIGNLTSLQELSWLDVEDSSPRTLAEIGNLTKLTTLSIYGLNINERYWRKTFLQSLSNLCNLCTLNLDDPICGPCSLDCIPDRWRSPAHLQSFHGGDFTFSQLPRWFSSLSELSCLSISVEVLRQEDLQLLGALPVLRFLELAVDWRGTSEERLVIGSNHPFRSLAVFQFTYCMRCWLIFAQRVMPKLQRLKLGFEVRKIKGGGFDVGLQNLACLKHITVVVDCYGARIREVEDIETTIRDAIGIHSNHPTLKLVRLYERDMVKDKNKDDCEASEQQSSDDETANDSEDSEQN